MGKGGEVVFDGETWGGAGVKGPISNKLFLVSIVDHVYDKQKLWIT